MIRGKRNFIPVHRLEMGFGLLFRLGDEASVSRHLPASHHVHHASGEGGIKGGEDVDSDIEDNTVDLKIEESPSPVEMKEKSLAGSEVDQEAASPDVVTSSSPGKRKKEEAQTREQDKKKKNETSSLVEGSASSPPPVSLSASPECPPTSPSSSSSALPVVSSSVRKKCVFTTPGEEAAKIRGGGGKEENEEEPTAREGDSHHPGSARRTSGGKKSARIGFVEGSSPPSSAADDNRLSGEEEEALASGREGGVSSRSEGGGPSGGGGVTVRFSSTEKTGELLESASASVSRRKNRKPTGFLRDADIRKKAVGSKSALCRAERKKNVGRLGVVRASGVEAKRRYTRDSADASWERSFAVMAPRSSLFFWTIPCASPTHLFYTPLVGRCILYTFELK